MGSFRSSGEASVTQIEIAAESLHRSDIFHLVKEILGFILYIHQQIPAVLRHLQQEFDGLNAEYKHLVSSHNIQTGEERKISVHRKANMRKIEVKSRIKRMEKLMNCISVLLSAIQEAINEVPDLEGIAFLLGGSPSRPHYVYDILFSQLSAVSGSLKDGGKNKVAENLAMKAIRSLLSNDSSTSSFVGPVKLFVLIKCPSNFNSPLHFLPKRDFRYNKKILPIKLQIKCKVGEHEKTDSCSAADMDMNDMIWYQCRHTVKGLAFISQENEC